MDQRDGGMDKSELEFSFVLAAEMTESFRRVAIDGLEDPAEMVLVFIACQVGNLFHQQSMVKEQRCRKVHPASRHPVLGRFCVKSPE
jgi:hypothetical protein